MIGAPVWHFWIGLALTGTAVLASVGLIAYYMIAVQSKKHPRGKQARRQDL